MIRITGYSFALIAALSLAFANSAQADAIACSNFAPDVTGNVTPNDGCQIDETIDNDSPDATFLAGNWFGFSDWIFDAKDNDPGTGVDEGLNTLGFSVDGGLLNGEWSFSESISGLDVMLVFKDGNAAPAPLVAYLVSAQSGFYTSPFYNWSDFETQHQISHISVWFRESPDFDVPEPGTLGLLGLGLLGVGVVRRRRQSV